MVEEKTIEEFIEDCCVVDENSFLSTLDAYCAFIEWFQKYFTKGFPAHGCFGNQMMKKFQRTKSKGQFYYKGLKLK